MKEKQISTEKQWISFRVKPGEYKTIHKHFEDSTCKKMSEYARKVLLNKPVVFTYRNQTADEFLSVAAGLRKELNAIGNNFNQAVKKLHTLRGFEEFKAWYITLELERQTLLNKVEEIKKLTVQIHAKWSQE